MPPFIREVKRKNKDGTVKIYYAEVESVREGDKVHQKYIRSLGTDPTKPSNYLLEPVHFSYIALRLMGFGTILFRRQSQCHTIFF
jgi:hypothetical protein